MGTCGQVDNGGVFHHIMSSVALCSSDCLTVHYTSSHVTDGIAFFFFVSSSSSLGDEE